MLSIGQAKHGKDYEEFKDGGKEDARRKQIFLTTDAKIQKYNSLENVTYQLGHNKFSDMVNLFKLNNYEIRWDTLLKFEYSGI